MLIRVEYTDDSFDYVKEFRLDELIEQKAITKFRRSSGWVDIATGPLRQKRPQEEYTGVERRGQPQALYTGAERRATTN